MPWRAANDTRGSPVCDAKRDRITVARPLDRSLDRTMITRCPQGRASPRVQFFQRDALQSTLVDRRAARPPRMISSNSRLDAASTCSTKRKEAERCGITSWVDTLCLSTISQNRARLRPLRPSLLDEKILGKVTRVALARVSQRCTRQAHAYSSAIARFRAFVRTVGRSASGLRDE